MYVSKKSAPDGECVVELLFNSEDWTVEGIKQQSLHSIVQYHKVDCSETLYLITFELRTSRASCCARP